MNVSLFTARTAARACTTALALVALAGLVSGCSATPENPATATAAASTAATTTTEQDLLAEYDLTDLTGRELVDTLDALAVSDRPDGLSASVRADYVLLADSHDHTAEVPLDGDEVYVSIAPYQNQTHDCYYHNATGCRSELANTEVDVTITNTAGDQVLYQDTVQTFDNGFAGLWLPRDIDGTVTVTYGDQTATSPISTSGQDVQTCITTLQLS